MLSELNLKRLQLAIMSTAIVLLMMVLRQHVVSARELYSFNPKVTISSLPFEQLSYKELRSREICEMARAEGFTDNNCVTMISHLITECGSMTEFCDWEIGSSRSDNGWAFGIAQWHLCYREWDWLYSKGWAYYATDGSKQCRWKTPVTKMRDAYFSEHPDMMDWRGQAKRYIREMDGCTRTELLRFCIDKWNAHPDYMKRVDSKVSMAKALLF